MPTDSDIRTALSTVRYPGFSRDIVSFGLVKGVQVDDAGNVVVEITLATKDPNIPRLIHEQCIDTLKAVPGVNQVKLNFDIKDPPQSGTTSSDTLGKASLPGVKKIIAVASGKGGVGKSTVSTNLAVALAATGARVGLCDCDLYGPSIALMLGTSERPYQNDAQQIIPIERHGLQLMSMGFLLEDDSPVIVRGPIATRYTQQFLRQTAWDNLDFLVLDLPPGTGDIQLTIVQTVALDGAIIVTTPQEVALIDARKAAAMFAKVNVPILGIVENMSHFICPNDGNVYHIFGQGGGEHEARRLGVPLLAQIPIDLAVREGGDDGQPIALSDPADHASSAAFHKLAQQTRALLESGASQ